MGMEVTGKLHTIFETKQVSERFSKREFVVEFDDNPKYPQVVQFQLTGDRCNQLDGLHVGDSVRIEFSLRGREWKSPSGDLKYFNTLDVWLLESINGPSKTRRSEPSKGSAPQPPPGDFGAGGVDDDIPFATCNVAQEPSPIAKVLR